MPSPGSQVNVRLCLLFRASLEVQTCVTVAKAFQLAGLGDQVKHNLRKLIFDSEALVDRIYSKQKVFADDLSMLREAVQMSRSFEYNQLHSKQTQAGSTACLLFPLQSSVSWWNKSLE